jgi:hypothetical protein
MRWTPSDTVGFVIAAATFIVPTVAFMQFVDGMRKPGDVRYSWEYAAAIGICLAPATLSSLIAWRWGGSEGGRWAIHGLVATLMLVGAAIGCCLFFFIR